jgi:gamma-glutamyltranspeptidase/glutathione hydrolase
MEQGGSAIDAAIAASLVLSITVPHLGGVGGDFFALVRTANGRILFFNGSCGAPSRLSLDLLRERGLSSIPERGPLSITVPGLIEGLHLLWRRLGTLEWKDLVKPAAELARRGFPASYSLAMAVKRYQDVLVRDRGSKETYVDAIGGVGSLVKFPGLARLLEVVAEDPRAFYEGEPAQAIAEYVEKVGGLLSLKDMASCRAEEYAPISITYRDVLVIEMPPNTQGVTTLHALALYEHLGARPRRFSKDWVSHLIGVFTAAYWARDNYVSDPRYMRVSVDELLSKSFIERLARRASEQLRTHPVSGTDTTFFAVADRDGNVVAGIQSLFHPFGSGVTEPRFQVTLNSRASCFTPIRGHVNEPAPGKRPLHTLSAVVVEDQVNDRVVALGLSGGHLRPQLHFQLVTAVVDDGAGIQDAIEMPRFAWYPGTRRIVAEVGVNALLPGYEVEVLRYPSRLGVAAAVEVRGRFRSGYVDVRGDGVAVAEAWFRVAR